MTKSQIKKAAAKHALEMLGKEQYNNPELKSAKIAIMDDFTYGAEWILKQQNKSNEKTIKI